MNVLLVDDEKRARETLIQIAQLCCPVIESYREADSILSAIAAIQTQKPDILFLDINLGTETGFDLLQHFPHMDLNVIFVTAHNDYILRALRASAVDYLLKPVRATELLKAIHKAEKKLYREAKKQQLALVQNLDNPNQNIEKIIVKTSESIHVINVSDIIFCQSDKGYTTLYLTNSQKIMASKILREYEELLPKNTFMRVHQSFLVNLNHLLRYDKKDKNYLVTTDKHQIPVSHRLKTKLLAYLEKLNNK